MGSGIVPSGVLLDLGVRVSSARRIRICLKDLYHADVVEMIERETKKYELWSIEDPNHPDFERAFQLLWDCFGEAGEMEPIDAIRNFLAEDPFDPSPSGTYFKYFMFVAKDAEGNLRGVRDGTILINPSYDPDLCLVYLSHIYMLPEARGTVLSYWLRIAPLEVAFQFIVDLAAKGLLKLPQPEAPGKFFGMTVDLAAEMEFYTPEERISWQRIMFYGRGGFDVINPRHFPYQQPDFRPADVIHKTGNRPVPFMLLLRRIGRERQATLPLEEARAVMRLLYDDFQTFCSKSQLEISLDRVLKRLDDREAAGKDFVELIPLPTGAQNLHRLKRLFRYNAYLKYYPDAPETRAYLDGGIREQLKARPRYLDEEIAKIGAELVARESWVYGNRDKGFSWDGVPLPPDVDAAVDGDADVVLDPRADPRATRS